MITDDLIPLKKETEYFDEEEFQHLVDAMQRIEQVYGIVVDLDW